MAARHSGQTASAETEMVYADVQDSTPCWSAVDVQVEVRLRFTTAEDYWIHVANFRRCPPPTRPGTQGIVAQVLARRPTRGNEQAMRQLDEVADDPASAKREDSERMQMQ